VAGLRGRWYDCVLLDGKWIILELNGGLLDGLLTLHQYYTIHMDLYYFIEVKRHHEKIIVILCFVCAI
jgi:hypothetical protein